MKTTVLHIIQCLSRGGAARALITAAASTAADGRSEHHVISLRRGDARTIALAKQRGIRVLDTPGPDRLRHELEAADVVQLHFWNTPELYELLVADLPAVRLLLWCHVAGDQPPHVLLPELVDYTDCTVASSPYTVELRDFRDGPRSAGPTAIGLIPPISLSLLEGAPVWAGGSCQQGLAGGSERLDGIEAKPHEGFAVGYIGTLDFVKMHPRYVEMSAQIDIPDVRFTVCGSGNGFATLKRQAAELGVQERFDFRGYVEDIRSVIAELDVFGYPLCRENYSASELVLQEVMYVGVPPVLLPYGGAQRSVIHNQTGLIARNEAEYPRAIEYLHSHSGERRRLGRNARAYARRTWSPEKVATQWSALYESMMERPKRIRAWPTRVPNGSPHAAHFAQTLGPKGSDFIISRTSTDLDQVLDAERRIAASPPVLCSPDAGGILHYRGRYPHDGHLRLWSGLVLHRQGRYALAAGEFVRAIELGCDHWRVSWYLAQSAQALGQRALMKRALRLVPRPVPELAEQVLPAEASLVFD